MKRILLHHHALIVTLVTMLLLLAGFSASAQTTYKLWIAGEQVTSETCSDLSFIPGVTGTVSYDPTTKTLTLEDATIEVTEDHLPGISSGVFELTCVVKGNVSITSSWNAMSFAYGATIKGAGRLTLKSQRESAIFLRISCPLHIDGCTVSAEGKWGISGYDGYQNLPLTIKNASVTAKGTEGSICSLASFTLEGCEITKPAGAVWNPEEIAVCDAAGNVITDEVVITPTGGVTPAVEEYNLYIAGVEVTSANCSDLSNISGVTGQVSYDPDTQTLYLENATIEGGDEDGISSSASIACDVKGDVNVNSNKGQAIFFYDEAIIFGGGNLRVRSNGLSGIDVWESLTIRDCTVHAQGKWGITANNGARNESLTIQNASVTAKGTEGSIRDFSNFTLERCGITKPMGAVWDDTQKAICNGSDKSFVDEVVIEPVEEYNLKIAGVEVNSANCQYLSYFPGIFGTVTYDPNAKTLYLENATIEGGDEDGISSSASIACDVKGDVNVNSNKGHAIFFYDEATIFGGGNLRVRSNGLSGIDVWESLTIRDCTVHAQGKWGITANDGARNALTIKNAYVTAKGSEGSICDFANFTLEGCEITSPAGAVWNDDKHAVCDASGNVITDEVVITPVEDYNFEIAGVEVTSANYKNLTDIPGVTGKVTYDPDTKTLTLEDATIEGESAERGISSTDELTCIIKGNVSITSSNSAMSFYRNTTIKGNGRLTLKSSQDCGIYIDKTLVIDGCTVYAEGEWGITGQDGKSEESLTIKNASVTAKGTDGSICDLAAFTLEGCEITKPAGAVWNDEEHAVCDVEGNVIKDEVVITPTGGTAIDFVTPEQLPAEGAIYDMNGVLRSEPLEELPTGVYIVGARKVMHVQR